MTVAGEQQEENDQASAGMAQDAESQWRELFDD
jgi:hypothetical protein